jgi:tetratricopeptide (TPR) repeat protein
MSSGELSTRPRLRALSIPELLDAALQLYRASFQVLVAPVLMLNIGVIAVLAATNGVYDVAYLLSTLPLRLDTPVQAVSYVTLGSSPTGFLSTDVSTFLVYIVSQVIATTLVIWRAAQQYMARFTWHVPGANLRAWGDLSILVTLPLLMPLYLVAALVADGAHQLAFAIGVGLSGEATLLSLLDLLAQHAGVMLAIGFLVVAAVARLLLAPAAAIVERQGPLGGLRRSWSLTHGMYRRTLLTVLLAWALLGLLAAIPRTAGTAVAASMIASGDFEVMTTIGLVTAFASQIVFLLAFPLPLVTLTLLYYDLRIRQEGYDLAVATHQITEREAQEFLDRGRAKLDQRDYEGAVADFSQVIARYPDHVEALSWRLGAHLRLSNYPSAIADAEAVCSVYPRSGTALGNLAFARYKAGDLAGAQADFERATRLPDIDPTVHLRHAMLLHKIGNSSAASAEMQRAEKTLETDPQSRYLLAGGYAVLGDADRALHTLEIAIAGDVSLRAIARHDEEFKSLYEDPRFTTLVRPQAYEANHVPATP